MKIYKNEYITDSLWEDILTVYEDFEKWAADNNYNYKKVECSSYKLPFDYPIYLLYKDEPGLIVWAGRMEGEGEFYIVPDAITVDFINGTIFSEDDFILYKPEESNEEE